MHLVHLSEKLRLLCSRYDLTQEQLGERLGIAHTTVGRWMKGSSRPYDRHAHKLAEIFRLTPEELLDDSVSLPTRVIDGRENAVKRAAERASRRFPGDEAAAQEAFEADLNHDMWRRTSLDTAEELRREAGRLIEMAERLEMPFQTHLAEVKRLREEAEAEATKIIADAEVEVSAARGKGTVRKTA